MSSTSRSYSFVLLALVSLVLGGCSQSADQPAADGSGSEGKAKKLVIGMSQCNLGEPWRVQMNSDIKFAASKHSEIEVLYKDAQNDTLKQRAHVEEFVSSGVDLLLISPLESVPLTEPIAKAFDAGIPVIVIDRAVLGDKYTCFIGADNVAIGRAAGRWIAEHLGEDGTVVELKGLMTSDPARDRHNGFVEGLGDKGEVIFDADMKWLEPNARKEMESALSRFDKIDVLYAHNDPGAHGAYLAARAAGREKDILFVGIDALPQEGVAYVKQGVLDASFYYPTGGAEAIETALKILASEEVPKQITLGSRVFTKENVDAGGEVIDTTQE